MTRSPRLATALGLVALLLVVAVQAASAADVPPAAGAAPPYQTFDVTDSVVMVANTHGSNLACIRHGDGLVFVDTGLSSPVAAHFRTAMERRFGVRARVLVLTHAHIDHVLGMAAFADVPVVAAAAGRPFLERLASFTWSEEAIASFAQVFPTFAEDVRDAKPFVPTVWFDDEHQLGSTDDPLVVRRTGGHSACSSHVWWPRARVVVAGDLLQARRRPYFGDPATDMTAWIGALDRWLADGATGFCPGHGPVIDAAEVGKIRDYFKALTTALAGLKARGVSAEAAVDDPSLPAGYWPAGPAPRWWPASIAAAYRTP